MHKHAAHQQHAPQPLQHVPPHSQAGVTCDWAQVQLHLLRWHGCRSLAAVQAVAAVLLVLLRC